MVSPHVAHGRRNLAANTVFPMRNIGMNAFQTVLLPRVEGREIKRMNHLDQERIVAEKLDVQAEIDRAFAVSACRFSTGTSKIHYVGDILEVMLNIHSWNEGISTENGRMKWGKRTVAYFAYDPRTKSFAPAKFCAYTVVIVRTRNTDPGFRPMSYSKMTIDDYVRIDSSNGIFDGNKAWTHLAKNLCMEKTDEFRQPAILKDFEDWMKRNTAHINVHPRGPIFVAPPFWFRR